MTSAPATSGQAAREPRRVTKMPSSMWSCRMFCMFLFYGGRVSLSTRVDQLRSELWPNADLSSLWCCIRIRSGQGMLWVTDCTESMNLMIRDSLCKVQMRTEIVDGFFKALFQSNPRLPFEQSGGLFDIGSAYFRVIDWKGVLRNRAR